jgi:UDP-N-acetylglucosamine--N-acetylmuramyl-(pentapeptide) pyrophosphoryl-undecaprenol N-acetylglucosamine transferase
MNNTKRLLVMAGGTGGHVFPALAVAQELRDQGWEILWLGTPEKMEAQLVPKYGFNIELVTIEGLRGHGFMRLIKAPYKIIQAILKSKAIIKRFQPDLVLGMGGFASGPGGIAAWLSRTPLILHEQNAIPGLTNRILAYFATQVLCGFAGAFSEHKATVVGNPIRADLLKLQKSSNLTRPLNLLVVGGSLGARVLNQVLPETAQSLKNNDVAVHIWHQVGKNNQQQVEEHYNRLQLHDNVRVDEFIHEMNEAYEWADLIVCRSGALTVSEVAAIGLPSILVPLPHAVDDHQTYNAKVLTVAGAGLLLPQDELSAQTLCLMIIELHQQRDRLQQMALHSSRVSSKDATIEIATRCNQVAQEAHNID